MSKKIIFSMPNSEAKKSIKFEFDAIETKLTMNLCLFSTAYNRNRVYFQVSKLMKNSSTLGKILFNLNHDLSLTNNQYLGNQTKLKSLWSEFVDGELEIHGIVESTDPLVIARKDEITGPSIELLVDSTKGIINENGEYYDDFEFYGCALLLGQLAGSGNSRVNNIEVTRVEYNTTIDNQKAETNQENNQNNMSENEVKTYISEALETQKLEILEEVKKTFDTTNDDSVPVPKSDDPEIVVVEDPEEKKDDEDDELTKIENSLKNKANFQQKLAELGNNDDLVKNHNDVLKSAETKPYNFDLNSLVNLNNLVL